ncbi:MAG: hypothetical protein Q8L66_07630 [Caulobacter sp.]|nr:hypothetical protein [Caulobacter sp.]
MAADLPQSHGADAAHAETTGVEHESSGLPQFEFQHWGGQIAYLALLFVVLYLLVARVFTPRMRKVIDGRATSIAEALEAARRVQSEAEGQAKAAAAELAEARGQSQRLAAEARAAAAGEAAERSALEDARVAEHIAKAETRITIMRDKAMGNVAGIADDVTRSIVEKLTGKAPSAADVKAALAGRGAN